MDINNYRLQKADVSGLAAHGWPAQQPRRMQRDWFVLGPLPGPWISGAAKLPGKALHVGLALLYLKGLGKSPRVKLTHITRTKFSIGRDAAREALRRLEQAGLVTVERRPGCAPVVTIHDSR